MKKSTVAAIAAVAATLSAADFPLTVDFKNVSKAGISATVENNVIVSKNKYGFAEMKLPASNKNMLFSIKMNGNNASFGAQLFDMSGKRIRIIAWANVPVHGVRDYSFIIPAANLKQPSKLNFYSIGKKPISITSMKVEFTDKTKIETPKAQRKVPTVTIPFKADFSKKQTGFTIYGQPDNGKITSKQQYCFGAIYIPATEDPLSCTLTLTAQEAEIGIIVYEVNEKLNAGKRLQTPTWGKRLGQAEEAINFSLPAYKEPRLLLMYNKNKKGAVTVDNVELRKMK